MRTIKVSNNKSLRLDNVFIRDIHSLITKTDRDLADNECFSLDLEVEKMQNEIKAKGANQIGPLIQYSYAAGSEEEFEMKFSILLQVDRNIHNISSPYRMESVVKAKNCMYTRFTGQEEDIQYAYKKMSVMAYEEDIKLKGSSYTIFLDSKDDGTIIADIFMERADA